MWFRIFNHATKKYFAVGPSEQRWTDRASANKYRDILKQDNPGVKFSTRAFYPPTVGNPAGGKPDANAR